MAEKKALPKFRRVQQVTIPTLKVGTDTPIYVKVVSAMTLSTTTRKNTDGTLQTPATVMRVVNLESGEMAQVVCPSVLVSNLNTHYPAESYVGKSFEIIAHAAKDGKRYRTVDVYEIDPNEVSK